MSTQKWTDEDLKKLEDADEWDWENAVTVHPSGKSGTVVAVRFSADQLELVARYTESQGKKLSDFVRDASLTQARTKLKRSTPKPPG